MQNWEYTFPPASKEEWIRQITRDLKGKPFDALHGEWWPGEPLVPLHHASDSQGEPIVLPDILFATPPRILESISLDGRSASQINQFMLEALQFGTQEFLIRKTDGSKLDPNIMLEGIHLNMIDLIIYDHADASHFFETIYGQSRENCFLRFQRNNNSAELKTCLEKNKINSIPFNNLQFEYLVTSPGNWVVETVKVFLQIIEDYDQWQNLAAPGSFFEKCILKLEADRNYFKQIVQARVLHLLWLNLRQEEKAKTEAKPGYLECHILPLENESSELYLISASMSSLAAFLTGIASLCIHHHETEATPGYFRRIDRNLHHLLHLESGLPVGRDPLAGAYTIDHYTRVWTERIWNELHPK